MRPNLKDITFLILVRLDSVQRLENILTVMELIKKYFDTTIIVREACSYNNGILQKLLNKNVDYEFIEDKDPILYKTKHVNQMTASIKTPYLAIWDVDIIPDRKAVLECVEQLRERKADVAYPYNGQCYELSESIKTLFIKKKDIRILIRHQNKLDLLHNTTLVGGAVLMNKEKFIYAGKEEEKHYGWGCDDYDRFERFKNLNFNIYRTDNPLFHLWHPREKNSSFTSLIQRDISVSVRERKHFSSEKELIAELNPITE